MSEDTSANDTSWASAVTGGMWTLSGASLDSATTDRTTRVAPNTTDNPFKLPAATRRTHLSGVMLRFAFENTYDASVVRHIASYGNQHGLWELAVLHDDDMAGPGDVDDWELTYDTPITDDVIGHLNIEQVNAILDQVAAL